MPLSVNEIEHFYSIWFPILNYANRIYRVNDLKSIQAGRRFDLKKVKQISERIHAEKDFFELYLQANPEIPEADKALVIGWKRALHGNFIIERILKRGAMLISDSNEVYQVQPLYTPWDEIFGNAPLPLMIETTLLPFGGAIITDGLFWPFRVYFGPSMRADLKEIYTEARAQNRIHKTL